MGRKKSFNPFKMWGSYVGAILITAIAFITQETGQLQTITGFLYKPLFFVLNNILGGVMFTNIYLSLATTILYGFLIGWGIHSFFRRISR